MALAAIVQSGPFLSPFTWDRSWEDFDACEVSATQFLLGVADEQRYTHWLRAKAVAHCRRDRGRGNFGATPEQYRDAIHSVVIGSGGVDASTGLPLRWDLISLYDSDESQNNGRPYKQQFGDLPTVDHISDSLTA